MNKRIQAVISALGESNNQFAKRINTSSAVVSHIVTGRNRPNIDLLYKILKSLPNVSIKWLIMGEGNMYLDDQKALDEIPEDYVAEESPGKTEADPEDTEEQVSAGGGLEWVSFVGMFQQMMASQRMIYKSMEQQIAAQQQLLEWLKANIEKHSKH